MSSAVVSMDDLAERVPIEVGGVSLPPGRLIRPQLGEAIQPPVMWATTDQIPEPGRVWLALMEVSTVSGLVPIVLDELEGQPERPWDSGELDPRRDPTPSDLDELAFADTDAFEAYPDTSVDSVRTLAAVLLRNPIWRFWFD